MDFDKYLRSLVKTCQDVVKADSTPGFLSSSLLSTDDGIPVKYLNRYEITFRKESLEIHRPFVLELYLRFKHLINKNKTDFAWIENNSVVLILGDGTDRPSNNIRVMVSHFYRQAKNLAQRVEKQLDGHPASDYDNRLELIYPEIILLYLFRLFRDVAPDQDKSNLDFIVKHLESSLGKGEDCNPDTTPDPMANVLSLATSFMSKMGLKPPADSKMPNTNDISNIFQKILSDPKTNETFSELFKNIGEAKDLNQMMVSVGESVKNGKLNNLMSELVNITEKPDLEKPKDEPVVLEGPVPLIPGKSCNSTSVPVVSDDGDDGDDGEIPIV